jgi:RNA polymerase sigma-70 factor (ECF subfamily)
MPDDQNSIDSRSFEALFRTYNAGLKVYALRMVRQLAAAEDIVHNTFMNLWSSRERIREETIKAWLFSVVRNECLKYLEHLRVRSAYQEKVLRRGDVSGSLTWEYYVLTELEEHLERALSILSPQQRTIFNLSRIENKSSVEIGLELGISPRTVEKHLEMALRNLRKELSEYLPLTIVIAYMAQFMRNL